MKTLEVTDPGQLEHWGNANFYTYLLLPPKFDFKTLEAKLPAFGEKYTGENLRAIGGKMQILLQPLTDIHLYSNLDEELEGNSDIGYVYAFSAIALFVLLMACINFMKNKRLGFKKEQMLVLTFDDEIIRRLHLIDHLSISF